MTDATTTPAEVRYEAADGIATITLHRPERRNAFTATMCAQLVAAYDAADFDDAVRAVVVTGSGRDFCAGADLDAGGGTFDGKSGAQSSQTHRDGVGKVAGVPRDLGGVVALRAAAMCKPMIAAVNGVAVGVGATLTLPMDIRLAGESARFGFVFARRGLVPEAASSWFLPRVVGISQAMEWVATGRVFNAREAHQGRLVSQVLPDDALLETAFALAREIADHTSPVAVAAARRMMWAMLGAANPWEAHALDSQAVYHLGAEADVAEGITSFLEKRPPRFTLSPSDDFPAYLPAWP